MERTEMGTMKRMTERTLGLRIAAASVGAGGALALVAGTRPPEAVVAYAVAALVAAGLVLHRAEVRGEPPRSTLTVVLAVVLTGIGQAAVALITGSPDALVPAMIQGMRGGLLFGTVAALLQYALLPRRSREPATQPAGETDRARAG